MKTKLKLKVFTQIQTKNSIKLQRKLVFVFLIEFNFPNQIIMSNMSSYAELFFAAVIRN